MTAGTTPTTPRPCGVLISSPWTRPDRRSKNEFPPDRPPRWGDPRDSPTSRHRRHTHGPNQPRHLVAPRPRSRRSGRHPKAPNRPTTLIYQKLNIKYSYMGLKETGQLAPPWLRPSGIGLLRLLAVRRAPYFKRAAAMK